MAPTRISMHVFDTNDLKNRREKWDSNDNKTNNNYEDTSS